MRKLAIGLALASTALASPSMARDGQWYVGVDGGVMLVEDLDLNIGPAPIQGTAQTDTGYDFGAVVGYDFGGFRLEAETSYREADLSSFTSGVSAIPKDASAILTTPGRKATGVSSRSTPPGQPPGYRRR